MFSSLLIANRGEIARRIARTARALGIEVVAVHSDVDAGACHVREADRAVEIGSGPPAESYLSVERVVDAAVGSGAQAVHPGYGFLAESSALARGVLDAGLTWVGPSPDSLEVFGDKAAAQKLMAAAGVPVSAGGEVADVGAALEAAREIGYPIMVKAAAGGGGIGMRRAEDDAELESAFTATRRQAETFFGDGRVLVERYLPGARHVEIQVLGLADGRVVALGERECSVQRRFQKLIEETPSPALDEALRAALISAAVRGAESAGYRNAGTFEFLVSGGEFVFLEVNARLQVEHPITELVTGVDLVAEQLRIAAGQPPGADLEALPRKGHAIELRICAEDPATFFPSPGVIDVWREPSGAGVRVDAGYTGAGQEVPRFYDSLLAKLCLHGTDRGEALERARRALEDFDIQGIKTNRAFLAEVLESSAFRSGEYDTRLVTQLRP